MLTTKQAEYVVWIYQGAGMGATAATVGEGLMDGYIYFRPTDDFLNEGERILRDDYYVDLSDGSEYVLGQGASSSKVHITNLAYLNGDARIKVTGIPDVGVGVARIVRRVVIEYNDNRVAVLDEAQLNTVTKDLHDEVSKSLEALNTDVKAVLRQEMESLGNELKDTLHDEITEADNEVLLKVDNRISTLRGEIEPRIITLESDLKTLTGTIESINTNLTAALDAKARIGRWSFGQYTVSPNNFNNVLFAPPTVIKGDPVYIYSTQNKAIALDQTFAGVDRIFKATCTATIEVPDGYAGYVTLHLRNVVGGTYAQDMKFISRANGLSNVPPAVQFTVELYIPEDAHGHPLYSQGLRLEYNNTGPANIVVKPGNITLTLLTA